MIREDHVTIEIAGGGAALEDISVSALGRVLTALEAGISTVSIESASDHMAEKLAETPLAISLVEVKEGNSGDYWARLHSPGTQLPAFAAFSGLIRGGETGDYPPAAVRQAEEIAVVCRANGYTVSMSAPTAGGVEHARVTPDSSFPLPDPATVRGHTVIFGQIERVGGRDPRVAIRTRGGQRIAATLAERGIANALGERLYETCGIEGIAQWNAETEELAGFTVTGLTEYAGASPASAVERLRAVAGGHYAEIEDVAGYVREERSR